MNIDRTSTRETIQILEQWEWLDEYLKGRLMTAAEADVVELHKITDGLHDKELIAWLKENGLERKDE